MKSQLSRRPLIRSADWDAARSVADLTDRAVERARRLAGLGVTHFNVPLSYHQIGLEEFGGLLSALRAA
jgi:hypothetical protein